MKNVGRAENLRVLEREDARGCVTDQFVRAVWCLESGAAALPIRVHCDINMWLKVTVKYPTPNLNKWLKIYIWQWRPNTYINGNISYSTNKLYLVYL